MDPFHISTPAHKTRELLSSITEIALILSLGDSPLSPFYLGVEEE